MYEKKMYVASHVQTNVYHQEIKHSCRREYLLLNIIISKYLRSSGQ
jgi:hypothetical protein